MINTPNIDLDNIDVRMDKAESRFHVTMIDAEDAYLEYQLHDDNTMEFTKTYVPESLREMGLGEHIVNHAFEFVRQNDRRVKVSCPFVENFLTKYDHYREYVVE